MDRYITDLYAFWKYIILLENEWKPLNLADDEKYHN